MKKRYHCEFKECECEQFKGDCNNLCIYCKHANIWHSLISKQVDYGDLSFVSPRLAARTPIYVKKYIKIAVFIPEVPPLPESDDELLYCKALEVLPV